RCLSDWSSDVCSSDLSPHHGGIAALWVTNSDSKSSRSERDEAAKEKESQPTLPRERKKIILYQFDRKFGDVSVQPVIGQVNGAQIGRASCRERGEGTG